ncbi:hypothetical protein G6F32_014666 [Rhizopus arrhizus]|nr:hypothetical protein G6F32_014666 [Rhizopus arrhizus]
MPEATALRCSASETRAEAIVQAQLQQLVQRAALGGGGQDVVFVPHLRGVHVARVRGDVEVAHHDQLRVALQFFGDPGMDGLQPAQLVVVLVGADVLAVDHVQVDHPQVAEGAGDDTLLLVLEAGNADLHVFWPANTLR